MIIESILTVPYAKRVPLAVFYMIGEIASDIRVDMPCSVKRCSLARSVERCRHWALNADCEFGSVPFPLTSPPRILHKRMLFA